MLRAAMATLLAMFLAGGVHTSTAEAKPTPSAKSHAKAKRHKAHKAKRTASKAKHARTTRAHEKPKHRHADAPRRPLPP